MGRANLAHFVRLARTEQGLCVVSTLRPDRTIQASLVNAGVMAHPVTGGESVGFVVRGGACKLSYLRADPTISITVRSGWDWATVEGAAELIGPDEPAPTSGDPLRLLLRDVFTAAGGTHDDWEEYDRAMADERRVAVLVTPHRAYTNRR
jgi:PPOX class probable F420-dependent enzyme